MSPPKQIDPYNPIRLISPKPSRVSLALIYPPTQSAAEERRAERLRARAAQKKAARAEKDFATSDAIRDELAAKGVEVMDGDPLGWEWKLA